MELRHRYDLKLLLNCSNVARSSFYYYQKQSKTADKYKKVYKAYTLDPAKQLRNGIYVDDSGLKMNLTNGVSPEMVKEIEKDRLDKIKKFNNFIDIE